MVILYPTDTAYALGCDFQNQHAIDRILRIKKRTNRRFTLIAASRAQVKKFFPFSPCQQRLAKKYWPGALSIVVNDQFAVRVPNHAVARQLARAAQTLLVATSANISGEEEIYSLDENEKNHPDRRSTLQHLKKYVDDVIDIGPLPQRKPSTIVECRNHTVIVHRQGPVLVNESLLY